MPAARVIAVDAEDFATATGDAPKFAVSTDATLHEEDTTPLPLGNGCAGQRRAGNADALAVPDRCGRGAHDALCVMGDAPRGDGANHLAGHLVSRTNMPGGVSPPGNLKRTKETSTWLTKPNGLTCSWARIAATCSTMSTADADSAINDHWARDPYSTEPYGTGHDALTDEERAEAHGGGANVGASAMG